jgi:hypothetical protein
VRNHREKNPELAFCHPRHGFRTRTDV